jgi:hypothetical protein
MVMHLCCFRQLLMSQSENLCWPAWHCWLHQSGSWSWGMAGEEDEERMAYCPNCCSKSSSCRHTQVRHILVRGAHNVL